MGTQLIDDKRGTFFFVDPDKIVIIGHDTKDGPSHPLYDPRAMEPPPEKMIQSMLAHGNIEPVIVRMNGKETIELVAGRKRVLAARVAKKIQKKNGQETIKVKVHVAKGSDAKMMCIMVAENHVRIEETPVESANKALRMVDMGAAESDVCTAFGWSAPTLKMHLALLDLHPTIQQAVQSGRIGMVAASKFSDYKREQQLEEFTKLQSEGKLSTVEVTTAVQNSKAETKAKKTGKVAERKYVPPSKVVIRKLSQAAVAKKIDMAPEISLLLRWVLGEVSAKSVPGLTHHLKDIGAEVTE